MLSLKVFNLDEIAARAFKVTSIFWRTTKKPSFRTFVLHLSAEDAAALGCFTGRRSCGTLCATSPESLGALAGFAGITLTVTAVNKDNCTVEVSAREKITVDIESANNQLTDQRLQFEFR